MEKNEYERKILLDVDDFKYIGSRWLEEEKSLHAVTHIDSFVADDNMIQLTTKAISFNGGGKKSATQLGWS